MEVLCNAIGKMRKALMEEGMQTMTLVFHNVKFYMRAGVLETVVSMGLLLRGEISVADIVVVQQNL